MPAMCLTPSSPGSACRAASAPSGSARSTLCGWPSRRWARRGSRATRARSPDPMTCARSSNWRREGDFGGQAGRNETDRDRVPNSGKNCKGHPMRTSQILGVVALVLGAVLLFFGYQSSNAPLDQVSNAVTGRFTDQTMWYLIGGIGIVLFGGLLTVFGRRL